VLATISDRKLPVPSDTSSLIQYYEPDIVTAQDYYPFGMMSRVALPNNDVPYKFGFNGKWNDNEVKGLGNQQDYGMRVYDPRIGRFLSLDPLQAHFPWYTPYQFSGNTTIQAVDLDGREERHYTWVKDDQGKPVLMHLYDKPIKEQVIVGYRNSHSLYNDGAIPIYETKVNARQVFVLHQEKDGTVEKFDKVKFVTYDQTTSYQGFSDMLQNKNGIPGLETLKFYLAKGAQNAREENSSNGGAGMYVNLFSKGSAALEVDPMTGEGALSSSSKNKIINAVNSFTSYLNATSKFILDYTVGRA
jgi:RHS repeat-associated protein